jgi:hypothetical protein
MDCPPTLCGGRFLAGRMETVLARRWNRVVVQSRATDEPSAPMIRLRVMLLLACLLWHASAPLLASAVTPATPARVSALARVEAGPEESAWIPLATTVFEVTAGVREHRRWLDHALGQSRRVASPRMAIGRHSSAERVRQPRRIYPPRRWLRLRFARLSDGDQPA